MSTRTSAKSKHQRAKPTRQDLMQIIVLTMDDIQRFDHLGARRLTETGAVFLRALVKNGLFDDGEVLDMEDFATEVALWQSYVNTFKFGKGPSRLPVFKSFLKFEPFTGPLCLTKKIQFLPPDPRRTYHISSDWFRDSDPDIGPDQSFSKGGDKRNQAGNFHGTHHHEGRDGLVADHIGLLDHSISLLDRSISLLNLLSRHPQPGHEIASTQPNLQSHGRDLQHNTAFGRVHGSKQVTDSCQQQGLGYKDAYTEGSFKPHSPLLAPSSMTCALPSAQTTSTTLTSRSEVNLDHATDSDYHATLPLTPTGSTNALVSAHNNPSMASSGAYSMRLISQDQIAQGQAPTTPGNHGSERRDMPTRDSNSRPRSSTTDLAAWAAAIARLRRRNVDVADT